MLLKHFDQQWLTLQIGLLYQLIIISQSCKMCQQHHTVTQRSHTALSLHQNQTIHSKKIAWNLKKLERNSNCGSMPSQKQQESIKQSEKEVKCDENIINQIQELKIKSMENEENRAINEKLINKIKKLLYKKATDQRNLQKQIQERKQLSNQIFSLQQRIHALKTENQRLQKERKQLNGMNQANVGREESFLNETQQIDNGQHEKQSIGMLRLEYERLKEELKQKNKQIKIKRIQNNDLYEQLEQINGETQNFVEFQHYLDEIIKINERIKFFQLHKNKITYQYDQLINKVAGQIKTQLTQSQTKTSLLAKIKTNIANLRSGKLSQSHYDQLDHSLQYLFKLFKHAQHQANQKLEKTEILMKNIISYQVKIIQLEQEAKVLHKQLEQIQPDTKTKQRLEANGIYQLNHISYLTDEIRRLKYEKEKVSRYLKRFQALSTLGGSKIKQIDSKIDILREREQQYEQKFTQYEQRLRTKENQTKSTKQQNEQQYNKFKAKIQQLLESIDEQRHQKQRVARDLYTKNQNIQELQTKINLISKQSESYQELLNQTIQKFNRLKDQHESVKNELINLNNDQEIWKKESGELIKKCEQKIANYETELKSLEQTNKIIRFEVKAEKQKNLSLSSALNQKKSQNSPQIQLLQNQHQVKIDQIKQQPTSLSQSYNSKLYPQKLMQTILNQNNQLRANIHRKTMQQAQIIQERNYLQVRVDQLRMERQKQPLNEKSIEKNQGLSQKYNELKTKYQKLLDCKEKIEVEFLNIKQQFEIIKLNK